MPSDKRAAVFILQKITKYFCANEWDFLFIFCVAFSAQSFHAIWPVTADALDRFLFNRR